MIKTKVVWNLLEPLSPENFSVIENKEQDFFDMMSGEADKSFNFDDNTLTVTRQWINEEVATEWIEFVSQFNPILSTVVKE
jgi:hypothetical protein